MDAHRWSRHRSLLLLVILCAALMAPHIVAAQTPVAPPAPRDIVTADDAVFADAWQRVTRDFAAQLAAASNSDARKGVYRRMLERFIVDPRFTAQRNTPEYRKGLAALVRELPDTALAQSTNAPLTNPATNQLIERSGFSDLLALGGDFRRAFSADESAVSVNLNAVAFFGAGKGGDRSAPYLYSRREQWRRVGGTVTFGSKVPEKAITGLSGLPRANDLFDAIAWDAKLRVIGDRDPRASRWYPLLLGQMGQSVELLTRVLGLPVPPADLGPLKAAAEELLGTQLHAATTRIASSLQASVKGAGVHLTEVAGRNRYTLAAMLDKGFSGADLTANVSYTIADAPAVGATDPFKTKDVQVSAGVSGSILKNAIVDGRGVELSASAKSRIFVDDAAVPIDRKNTFAVNTTLALPFQLKATIPISFTWTNDPNNLAKEKYVTGQIGISYDFSAVWAVLKHP